MAEPILVIKELEYWDMLSFQFTYTSLMKINFQKLMILENKSEFTFYLYDSWLMMNFKLTEKH
ncbi:MAG TPA: hypothetical protein PKO18_00690 [Chitinophagales bacterium]|nr:hypothetical protein [Chitinophagales bacterium]